MQLRGRRRTDTLKKIFPPKYSLNDICVHLQYYCFLNQSPKLFSSENICGAIRQYLSPPPPRMSPTALYNGQSREEDAAAQSMPL